jgi:hypothetical protein
LTHFLGNIARIFGLDDANGEAAKPSDIFRAVTYAYSAAILVVVPVKNVMTAVLNSLMSAIDLKHLSLISPNFLPIVKGQRRGSGALAVIRCSFGCDG